MCVHSCFLLGFTLESGAAVRLAEISFVEQWDVNIGSFFHSFI